MSGVIEDLKNPKNILLVVIGGLFSGLFVFFLVYMGISAMYSSIYISIFDVVIRNTVAGFFFGLIIGASLMIIKHHYIDKPIA
jgi:hypothetical protein